MGGVAWNERSPQDKSSYFMAMYNRQFNDTMSLASTPGITEGQKEIVRQKKAILEKLHPAIKAYDEIVARGEIPSALDEENIFNLINRLAAVGG